MKEFGLAVKNNRTQLGLSMQELADRANASKSMISKIENNLVQPTLDLAIRIAYGLNTSLSKMLHEAKQANTVLMKIEDQPEWQDPKNKLLRKIISPTFKHSNTECLYITLPAKSINNIVPASLGRSEKWLFVTKGKLNIQIGEEIFQLKRGDSLYYEPKQQQIHSNPGSSPTEYILVCNVSNN